MIIWINRESQSSNVPASLALTRLKCLFHHSGLSLNSDYKYFWEENNLFFVVFSYF